MDLLHDRADPAYLNRLKSRLAGAATHGAQTASHERSRGKSSDPSPVLLEDVRAGQTLEDLLVQAEIFVQYSLQSKAVERLQKIVELFPGEAARNERLQSLFEAAHWWPQKDASNPRPVSQETAAEDPAVHNVAYAPETLRDLAKISEINQN